MFNKLYVDYDRSSANNNFITNKKTVLPQGNSIK